MLALRGRERSEEKATADYADFADSLAKLDPCNPRNRGCTLWLRSPVRIPMFDYHTGLCGRIAACVRPIWLGWLGCAMPTSSLTAETLARTLESFLLEAPHAVLIENGDVLFDFSSCPLLGFRRGQVRPARLVGRAQHRAARARRRSEAPQAPSCPRCASGKSKPEVLEICADRRTTAAPPRSAPLAPNIRGCCVRLLEREYPGAKIESRQQSKPTWSTRSVPCTREPCFARGSRRLPCWV